MADIWMRIRRKLQKEAGSAAPEEKETEQE